MLSFILRRLLVAIPTILILIVISFALMFNAPVPAGDRADRAIRRRAD